MVGSRGSFLLSSIFPGAPDKAAGEAALVQEDEDVEGEVPLPITVDDTNSTGPVELPKAGRTRPDDRTTKLAEQISTTSHQLYRH
jgi:hypothetical protein